MSDSLEALATRAQAGDGKALEELVAGVQDRIYRLAMRFLGHPQDARDATQEILILLITKLSTFRGDSAVSTWAYRIACRHLMRAKAKSRRGSFVEIEAHLEQPANEIEPGTLDAADARLLEEEVFLGCTQAMLRALDRDERIAFVLGAVCELSAADAALALEISEVAFRKRLSRARASLDAFLAKRCGVANPDNPCRCKYQINHRVAIGRLDPSCLRFASPVDRTSLEVLRETRREIGKMRRSLELYQAQPRERAPEDFSAHVRALVSSSHSRMFDA